jgi:superfamily I DNA/RNA helicase
MISGCLNRSIVSEFDLLCVDEIQDLTPLQMKFIEILAMKAKDVIYAGDGNQMIFEWAGVDRKQYMGLVDQCDVETLTHNYRLPQDINYKSLQIIDSNYSHKHILDNSIRYVDSIPFIESGSQALILSRNGYLLRKVLQEYEEMGLKWVWLSSHDNTSLMAKYNIKVSTIHGAKGAEADNVILLTDVSPATYEQIDSESERRVWYVGVTRARRKLYIVEPQSYFYYDLS